MKRPPRVLPPLRRIDSALRKVTEALASELVAPSAVEPRWDEFEWCIARAVAAMHGIAPLLSRALRWSSPLDWRCYLNEQREHVAARQRKMALLLGEIDSRARRAGISFVALKGAALHANGVYGEGERPMADVDFLVREAEATAATSLLERCDFELTAINSRHRLFEPRFRALSNSVRLGEHVDNPLKIELHTRIRESLPINETDITEFLLPIEAHGGVKNYPSSAVLMLHLLLHAAGNMRAHALRLIQLHDIGRLAARFGAQDWRELLNASSNGLGLWWGGAPLAFAARYYPSSIPPDIISELSAQCRWLLRRRLARASLADISWSNIKVYAFPGIEWSRTPREAIRFMATRIWPSPEVRLELHQFAKHQNGASEVPWYGISQPARIVRWLFSKPPRVQTLLPVRAAFEQFLQNVSDRSR